MKQQTLKQTSTHSHSHSHTQTSEQTNDCRVNAIHRFACATQSVNETKRKRDNLEMKWNEVK